MSVAELCCNSLKDFNPMVNVSVEKGDLASFDLDFFNKFYVVVVGCCSLMTKVLFNYTVTNSFSIVHINEIQSYCLHLIQRFINEKCRKLSKSVAFYTVDCRDSCGEIFVDLQNYTYSKKKLDETTECHLRYPSFEEAVAIPWRSLPKRVSKLYFAMGLLERFEEVEKRNPDETSIVDLNNVLKLKKELCQAHSLNESQIPDSLLGRLVGNTREFPPVCAVLGGILGQEVIKALSGKGDPLKNFFFFDAVDGKGIIEDICSSQLQSCM